MPKHIKTLTDTEVKNLKPKEKDYKLSDGNNKLVFNIHKISTCKY